MELHDSALGSVPIKGEDGRTAGTLHFLCTDAGMFTRFLEDQGAIQSVFESLKSASFLPNGRGKDADSQRILDEAEEKFEGLIDHVCGVETAGELFKHYRPFAVLKGGMLWADVVLRALGDARKIVEKNLSEWR